MQKFLINKNVNISINKVGSPIITDIVELNDKDVLQYVLKNKININDKDFVSGKTALMIAKEKGYDEIVQILEKADVKE